MDNDLSAPLDEFKERELEILNLMAQGLSNAEIAAQLFITKETVRWYNKQIYSKLGTSRRTEAIALARQMNLIGDAENEAVFNNVPIATGTFWGRERELQELSNLIAQPNHRLITLVAPGGMGKTRLAIELAHQIAGDFADGVYFFDLAPLRDAQNIIPLMIELFELSPSAKAPMEPVLDYCRDKILLLLFDNFETVMPGVQYLVDILGVAKGVKIVVTTRERLEDANETVFRLNPLQHEAENLFIEMAQRRLPEFEVTEQNSDHIRHVCELVEGLPLGIILAAAWVDVLSVEEIAEEIQHNFDFLEDELATLPRRQRSIRAVLQQTWGRLTDQERRSFMRLSVFRGGFNRQTAQDVTETGIHTLQSLLGKALIQRKATGRFDFHALIREFAQEKLSTNEPDNRTYRKHIQFFHDYLKDQNEGFEGKQFASKRQNVQTEYDNIIAAIDHAFITDDPKIIVPLVIESASTFINLSQISPHIQYIERSLKYDMKPIDRVKLLTDLGEAYHLAKHLIKAQTACEQALKLIDEHDIQEPSLHADIAVALGMIAFDRGENAIARDYLTSARDVFVAHDNKYRLTVTYEFLGLLETDQHNFGVAEKHILRAIQLRQELGDMIKMKTLYGSLGILYDSMGNLDQARDIYEQYLSLVRELNDQLRIGTALTNLGWNAEQRRDYESAFEYYEQALTFNKRFGNRHIESAIAINMGFLALQFSDIDAAYDSFVQGISTAMVLGLTPYILEALVGVALVAYRRQDYRYSATLVEFVTQHDVEKADIDVRLKDAALDFGTVVDR